ncbi:unnamed protein product [Gongylonema pulchrum]|uniref:Pecanex-like protein n=1 Tax=Gongylonema pulchrum TaxID=637853 RepID=A0A183EEH0_9BILA|nr:unnamed protein product [Gongylonema pulchrum]
MIEEKDDFFGIHDATETPLPRHMEAAINLRSRFANCGYPGSRISGSAMGSTALNLRWNRHSSQPELDRAPHGDIPKDGRAEGAADVEPGSANGLSRIWESIDPVWKMSNDQLVDLMASRIIHEDGTSQILLAFVFFLWLRFGMFIAYQNYYGSEFLSEQQV